MMKRKKEKEYDATFGLVLSTGPLLETSNQGIQFLAVLVNERLDPWAVKHWEEHIAQGRMRRRE